MFDSWVPFPGNPSIYTMLTERAVTSGLRRGGVVGRRCGPELLIAYHRSCSHNRVSHTSSSSALVDLFTFAHSERVNIESN